jgi:hypothetical protein
MVIGNSNQKTKKEGYGRKGDEHISGIAYKIFKSVR